LSELVDDLRYRRGDTTEVEVKSATGGAPDLADTLCAFANMPDGGTILLGLAEKDGFTPTGIRDVAALEAAVAAQARTAVNPPARCDFTTLHLDGQPVLAVDVEGLPLQQRPARHRGLAYLRQSDGDYVMSEQEIAQLELLKTQAMRPTHPDRAPVPDTSRDDLDPSLLDAYLAAARRESRRFAALGDDTILEYTSVLGHTGAVTLAGLYALGRAPQAVTPSLGVTAAVQLPRGSGARTRDLVHLTGPIPDLLDDTMDWVARNTRTTMGYDADGRGVDRPELPPRAVREIVANALVHRNLDAITDAKRVEIRLLDDRLVVSSPGGLWGVSESQLGRPGAKSAVNPVLYEICKLVRMSDGARVIEGEGGGLREAVDALRAAGLRAPSFVDTGLQFTVVVPRPDPLSGGARQPSPGARPAPRVKNAAAVLDALATHHTVAGVAEATALTDRQVRYALTRLVDAGVVLEGGRQGGRSATYQVAPEL
jgi:ATP-dependent DNA helicase RecG